MNLEKMKRILELRKSAQEEMHTRIISINRQLKNMSIDDKDKIDAFIENNFSILHICDVQKICKKLDIKNEESIKYIRLIKEKRVIQNRKHFSEEMFDMWKTLEPFEQSFMRFLFEEQDCMCSFLKSNSSELSNMSKDMKELHSLMYDATLKYIKNKSR